MLSNLRLSKKIPASIIAATLITSSAITLLAMRQQTQQAETSITQKMEATLGAKRMLLDGFFEGIVKTVHALADSPYMFDAARDFTAAYGSIGGDPVKHLQELYITQNPNETGKKHLLSAAPDGSSYSQFHGKYHPYFREFLEEHGLYDIFIVDTNGNVVYTVFKELDFATNVKTGQWKDSGLAKVYESIMAQKDAEDVSFVDFSAYAPSNNVPAAFIGRPIEIDGKYIGALIYQMPLDAMTKMFNETSGLGETGKILFVGSDGLLRNDVRFAKESTILKDKAETTQAKEALAGKNGVMLEAVDDHGNNVITAYSPYDFKNAHYGLVFEITKDEIMTPVIKDRNEQLIFTGIVAAIIAAFGVWFARTISRPITGITRAMEKIAQSDLKTEVPSLGRKDEIGEMATALQVFKENAMQIEKLQQQQEEQKKKAEEDKRAAMHELAANFERDVKGIVNIVAAAATELSQTAQSMTQTISQSSQLAINASGAATQTASNVQSVASAAEELSASVREISSQLQRTNQLVHQSTEKAQNADKLATALNNASNKVNEVMEMISSIAGQINLLALNATIESARAGEAGKGFAVVASEVKNLAGQTDKSVAEIQAVIEEMRSASEAITHALTDIKSSVNDISGAATTVASAVEEQSATTNEIARNMQTAAQGTQTISSNLDNVSNSAAEAGSAASQMLSASQELSRQAESLSTQVDAFMNKIRAA